MPEVNNSSSEDCSNLQAEGNQPPSKEWHEHVQFSTPLSRQTTLKTLKILLQPRKPCFSKADHETQLYRWHRQSSLDHAITLPQCRTATRISPPLQYLLQMCCTPYWQHNCSGVHFYDTCPWFHKKSSLLHRKVRIGVQDGYLLQKRYSLVRKKKTPKETFPLQTVSDILLSV